MTSLLKNAFDIKNAVAWILEFDNGGVKRERAYCRVFHNTEEQAAFYELTKAMPETVSISNMTPSDASFETAQFNSEFMTAIGEIGLLKRLAKSMTFWLLVALWSLLWGVLVASFLTGPAIANSDGSARPMMTGVEVVPPFGYIGFCLRNPQDCQSQASGLRSAAFDIALAPPVQMTDEKWLELNHVNDFVNRTVRPADDLVLHNRAEWWTYPTAQGGDCEDYALLKRKMLIQRGWPANSLLLSVVKQWDDAGHAVLLVVTERGEFVLDNQNWKVTLWQEAPYLWVKRQSRHHPYVWVNLDPSLQPEKLMIDFEPYPEGMDKRNIRFFPVTTGSSEGVR